MTKNTIRLISKVLCLVLIATFAFEGPLMAVEAIKVNVGGQQINVTPGQWIAVRNGNQTTHYNVRYVNGQPVALEIAQYMKLILGGNTQAPNLPSSTSAGQSSQVSQSVSQTPANAPVSQGSTPANTGTVAANSPVQASVEAGSTAQAPMTSAADSSVSGAAQSGGKSGSWIKQELSEYGSKIKDSFSAGKESGQAFGNKTVDTVKSGASKVGEGVKGAGSKIGDLLRGAKDRLAKIFNRGGSAKTGKADSAQSGQSEQSGQSGQSSQSGQSEQSGQSSQSGQSEQSGQTSGQSEQSGQVSQSQEAGQAGQSEQSGQAAQSGKEGKPGFLSNLKDKTATKFKSGYEAGKAMTNQGVQNVKDSLKSGFSPKNLLVTAGITVGVDLATQIMRGEKPSLKKAVKVVASAEFAGGVVGSVTGAAAGSFFVPFLSAIPVVGGVMSALAPTFGSIVGGSVGAYLAGDLKNGRFSIKNAFKQIDWIGVGGQTVGSTLGAMLGSAIFPPFGTIIGGMVGGYLGNWAAHKIAGLFGKDRMPGQVSQGNPLPVGTNPYDQAMPVAGSVTIGSVAGGQEIPVNADQGDSASTAIAASAEPLGTYASEIQLAEAKYRELYKLYNELLAQGKNQDAMKVAEEMNKAKAAYDALKAKASK